MSFRRNGLALALMVLVHVGSAAAATVANPLVQGPIRGGLNGYPSNAALDDLSGPGYSYSEDEYFASGTATNLASGRTAQYTSRMVARLPRDPAKFNGIVLFDWMNVTDGRDFEFNWWPPSREYLMQQGYGYVAVTAQLVAVEALRRADPVRYGQLVHPGDDYSFDIYAQIMKSFRDPSQNQTSVLFPRRVDPSRGLPVNYIVAGGVSQSAGRLAGFINGKYNRGGLVDAYNIERALGSKIDDYSTFIFELNEETSTAGTPAAPRPPDTSKYVVWEEAGSSHETNFWWDYRLRTQQREEFKSNTPDPINIGCSVNRARTDYSVDAMLFWTQLYLKTGQVPPSAPRVERTSPTDNAPKRDADGHVVGGLRHAFIEVPVALNSSAGCPIWGSYKAWTNEAIRKRYPTHAGYVKKVAAWADFELSKGWLIPEDRDQTVQEARDFKEPWPGEVLPANLGFEKQSETGRSPSTGNSNGTGTKPGTTPGTSRGAGTACLGRRGIRRAGLGSIRLGAKTTSVLAAAGSPTRVTKGALRYCVRGGGTVTAVLVRGKVALIATSARGTKGAGVRVGARSARKGLVRRGRVLYRVRNGRVAWVGVTRNVAQARKLARRV